LKFSTKSHPGGQSRPPSTKKLAAKPPETVTPHRLAKSRGDGQARRQGHHSRAAMRTLPPACHGTDGPARRPSDNRRAVEADARARTPAGGSRRLVGSRSAPFMTGGVVRSGGASHLSGFHRQPFAALRATPCKHAASSFGLHPCAKTMGVLALALAGLIRSFHRSDWFSFNWICVGLVSAAFSSHAGHSTGPPRRDASILPKPHARNAGSNNLLDNYTSMSRMHCGFGSRSMSAFLRFAQRNLFGHGHELRMVDVCTPAPAQKWSNGNEGDSAHRGNAGFPGRNRNGVCRLPDLPVKLASRKLPQ